MSNLQIRQGTVYEEAATGARWLYIHHNPMNLESMRIPATAEGFDCAHPETVSVDSLIEMRRSEAWRELGDVPANILQMILQAILASAELDDNTKQLLAALQNEGTAANE